MVNVSAPIVVLIVVAIGFIAIRPLPKRTRIAFDLASFIAISVGLWRWNVAPLYPTPSEALSGDVLWLRALATIWWMLGARLLVTLLLYTLHRDRRSRQKRLFSDLSTALIYISTALIILNSVLALPIRGLVATSGVVAIVLGLALQNTLADVFAGIAVGIEAPFAVGDEIKVGDTIEGQLVQLNWRSIHIQTDSGDVAILPNSLAAKSGIVNRSRLGRQHAGSVEVACPAAAAPEKVIEVLLEAMMLCPDILAQPAPSAILSSLGARRNQYTLTFYAAQLSHISTIKAVLLRQMRRQLHWAGMLFDEPSDLSSSEGAVAPNVRILRDIPLFEHLDLKQTARLASQLRRRVISKGRTIFSQGEQTALLFVVAAGVVRITRGDGPGAVDVVGCVGAGDYLGEISLLTGEPYAVTAVALTPCVIFELSKDALAPLMASDKGLVEALEASVQRSIVLLHRDVASSAAAGADKYGPLLDRIRGFFHVP